MPNTNGSEEKRFGISTLSKEKHTMAYEEELLGDKLTGELLFKTPLKDLVSFDYNTRLQSHIEHTELHAKTMGLFGKVYAVDNDGTYAFPALVPFNNNILDTHINIPSTSKKMVFNVDLDCLTCTEGKVSKAIDFPSIQFDLTIRDSGLNSHSVIREVKVNELNRMMINVDSIIADGTICNEIILNSIKVTPNADLNPDLNVYRLIMYNICIILA